MQGHGYNSETPKVVIPPAGLPTVWRFFLRVPRVKNPSTTGQAIATVNKAIDDFLTYIEKDDKLTKAEKQSRAYDVEKAWRTILIER